MAWCRTGNTPLPDPMLTQLTEATPGPNELTGGRCVVQCRRRRCVIGGLGCHVRSVPMYVLHIPRSILPQTCQYDNESFGSRSRGGRFKNNYELLNLRALKFSYVNKIHIFQCMGKIFCVEFQRYPLKFHTKYLTHTLKDMIFMQFWNFKSS